ncbi:MAG TPA: hypothetical protein VNJ12_10680 [Candidatus Dormibacteraeota bacterium]|nr:hypothetical protein [Candidatus Dormibacteraeota bacterium]
MPTVFVDSPVSDPVRRKRLYEGELFAFEPKPSSVALCEFARSMIEEAFGGIDPRYAQFEMPVERYVEIVAPLKPSFIHHPKTMELLKATVVEFGCDLDRTYIDVPRLRMVTHGGYLTSGVGYAHHPHRDTWYSAPMCQLNWWLPIYEIELESAMAFHPRYWNRPVQNSSGEFNYYEWNAVGRRTAAQQIQSDTRKQPHALEPLELEPEVRLVPPPGGVIQFSAAQLHSTVPNTSGRARYSIDFRTFHLDDAAARKGAPNLDSAPTGTSLRDFVRGTDFAPIGKEVVTLYDAGNGVSKGELIFRP